MPLDISSPVVVSEAGKWAVISVRQTKLSGFWIADILCQLKDESGKVLQTKIISIDREKYNDWWTGFNSGTALDILMATTLGLTPPGANSQESYYVNS